MMDREVLARVLFDHWKEKNPAYDYVQWGPWYRDHWLTFADAVLAAMSQASKGGAK